MRNSVDTLNESFHSAYKLAAKERQLDAPIFILIGDELISHHRGERRVHHVRPRGYHIIKAVSHAPIALYALGRTREHFADTARMIRARLMSARFDSIDGASHDDCQAVLQATTKAVDDYLEHRLDLETFTRDTGDALLRLRRHATALHLDALDRCVKAELERMDDGERGLLQVVVAGVHQARERSLGTQYFHSRLTKGCPAGERVLYGEGVRDEQAALELVSLQRFDREIASAFFGDPAKLQQDILGDAAEEMLATRFSGGQNAAAMIHKRS